MPNPNAPNVNNRWLTVLLLLPVFVLAALIGVVVFAIVLGLVAIAAMTILLRLWWLRRKMRKSDNRQVLEGEYRVVRPGEPQDPPG